MRIFLFLTLCSLAIPIFGQSSFYFKLQANITAKDYVPNQIIFKIKPQYASQCGNSQVNIPVLTNLLSKLGVSSIFKKFPNITSPTKPTNSIGQPFADLSLIYEMTYQNNYSIQAAINQVYASGVIDYAQPHYIMMPLNYIPNDPLNFNQYHLPLIQAYQAWDYYRGDTNTVIGICDWGTDINHPDLQGNLKYNKLDPIDGIDNDNDGYIDNYMGWDLGDNNNNPQGNITHGCFVAGLAAAGTDNNIGISGTGFLCKYLPIKIADTNNQGTMGFEGIVYAVEHGCSIINCSWGSTFNAGPFGQDVINYATINRGALVVAACGNDNNTISYYPASYNYVLSVAASNSSDTKWSGSSYGYFVDIAAPGQSVWSTIDGGTYGASSGTSFAAPIVSGCAALLKSKFPSLSGLQIGEKLRVSADIIDTISANLPYKDFLGSGRLNIYNALFDSLHPSIKMVDMVYADKNHDGAFTKNDTLLITGNFLNYLATSTTNLKATIQCLSANTTTIDSVITLGIIPTLGTVSPTQPFKIFLKPSLTNNEELYFKITFTDNNYRALQYEYLTVNINYLDIDTNQVATTINSAGMIGYNNGNSLQGLGFRYNNSESLLFSGGFIVGRSATQVSDAIYGATAGTLDNDFFPKTNAHRIIPSQFSDFDAQCTFNDSLAGTSKIGILVKQKAYAWHTPPNNKFILLEYTLINKTNSTFFGLYPGLYIDWDINNSVENRIQFDAANHMGYCYSPAGGTYTGLALISQAPLIHYAFDNNGANGSINVVDGFTDNEKYVALKTIRNEAGMLGYGNDVSHMISSGPYTLLPNDSVKVVFALMAGDHLGDLQATATAAYQIYNYAAIQSNNQKPTNNYLYQNAPNPFAAQTTIAFNLQNDDNIQLVLRDSKANTIAILAEGNFTKGMHTIPFNKELNTGIYFITLSGTNFSLSKKMNVIK